MSVNGLGGCLFLLDTGASASAIDSKTADQLGLPPAGTGKVEGTGGTIHVKKVLVKSLSSGKARTENLTIPAYDLGGILAPPNRRVAGILGYDFLRSFSVCIDFPKQALTFYTKGAGGPVNQLSAVSVPFKLDNGIPRLNALLNDVVSADFRLDTGASLFETSDIYLNVTDAIWRRLQTQDPDLKPERYFTGSGVGGDVRLPVSRIKRFSLNRITVSAPYVIVQPELGYFVRKEAAGFISNNFLEKFSPVTIDYLKHKLYLTEAAVTRRAFPFW